MDRLAKIDAEITTLAAEIETRQRRIEALRDEGLHLSLARMVIDRAQGVEIVDFRQLPRHG